MRKYRQGRFRPKNPEKYKGDPKNIIYRSSWEFKLLKDMDENPNVLEYSSEELIIPYISPKDMKTHRYFPDMFMKVKTLDGEIKNYLLEVKPKIQTKPPEKKKKITKTFINESITFAVNQAKWKAAQEFCKKHGWIFRIVTEDDLFPKKRK